MGASSTPEDLQALLRHYGTFIEEGSKPYHAELYRQTKLDEKTRELVVTALLALRGWKTGVQVHGRKAIDAGASIDEVRGAILVTIVAGGMAAPAQGLAWLDEALPKP